MAENEVIKSPKKPLKKDKTKKNLSVVLVVLIIIAFAGLVVLIVSNDPQRKKLSLSSDYISTNTAIVEVTKSGFVPDTIQIKKNTTVIWRNIDSNPHQPAADPFRTHESNPNLVALEALEENDSFSFTFDEVGEFGYHDNLNPDIIKGKVIVVK